MRVCVCVLCSVLGIVHRYQAMKAMSPEERKKLVPRVCIIGGKAAPGYEMAKRNIKLVRQATPCRGTQSLRLAAAHSHYALPRHTVKHTTGTNQYRGKLFWAYAGPSHTLGFAHARLCTRWAFAHADDLAIIVWDVKLAQ